MRTYTLSGRSSKAFDSAVVISPVLVRVRTELVGVAASDLGFVCDWSLARACDVSGVLLRARVGAEGCELGHAGKARPVPTVLTVASERARRTN